MDARQPLYRKQRLTRDEQIDQVCSYPDLIKKMQDNSQLIGNLMAEAGKRYRVAQPELWANAVSRERVDAAAEQSNAEVAQRAAHRWSDEHPGQHDVLGLAAAMRSHLDAYWRFPAEDADTSEPGSDEGSLAQAVALHARSPRGMPFHPAAQLMPSMNEEAYAALRADIAAHGLEQDIVLLDGMILDGRHREMACVQTETPARYRTLPSDTDPTRYVLSHGLNRRHLDPSQRQTLFALVTWDTERGGDRKSEKIKGRKRPLISARTAASDLGIGITAAKERKAAMKGDPEIAAAVESGEAFDAVHARVAAKERARKESEAAAKARERQDELRRLEAAESEAQLVRAEARQRKANPDLDARRRQRTATTAANSAALKAALIREGEEGRYGVVMADPPWALPRPNGVLPGREAENHYPTADLDAIKNMDVSCIADDAVLFLWVSSTMLPYAFEVIVAWDFDYHSNVVWVKRRPGEEAVDDPANLDVTISLGHVVRHAHEHLLIAKRGQFRSDWRADKGVSSVIYAPRLEHSRKPDAAYQLVERLYPDLPKIELFARRRRPGWTSWGNELNPDDAGH